MVTVEFSPQTAFAYGMVWYGMVWYGMVEVHAVLLLGHHLNSLTGMRLHRF